MLSPTREMNDPVQKIQIFLPGTRLEITPTGSQAKETRELITSKSDREQPPRKRRRDRQSLENGGESSHRLYSAKKSKQNDDNDVCQHLHPLQDYLCPGLDGTPFCQSCLGSHIELGSKVVFCGIK